MSEKADDDGGGGVTVVMKIDLKFLYEVHHRLIIRFLKVAPVGGESRCGQFYA